MKSSLSLIAIMLLSGTFAAIDAAEPAPRPFVVGHRGLLHTAPENTLAGFQACLALRVGFEFDIRRTKDRQLVCLHDDTLDRTTDGKGRLADVTLAELRLLEAGARFDPAFHGQRVPLVDEVFSLLANQASDSTLFAVDLKDSGDGLEEAVVRLAETHKVLDKLLFIGLTIESVEVRQRLRAASRNVHAAHLAPTPERIAQAVDDKTADWVYLRFLPAPEAVKRIHAAGKRLFIAGPLVAGHEPKNWAQAAELGFDGILTDFPLELMKQTRPTTTVKP